MRRDAEGRLVLAATDLVNFLECGHKTTLDKAVADGVLAKPPNPDDPTVELLQKRGYAHEQRYIELLRKRGRTVEQIPDNDAAATLAALRQGVDIIFQGTFEGDGWVGHPDFLLRTNGASRLGDFRYEIADTKLAHTPKAAALVQMCSYVEQLEAIQGKRPERVYVVTGGEQPEEHPFRTAELMAYYRHARTRFEDTLTGLDGLAEAHLPTYPDPVEHCDVCRWRVRCNAQWHADDALPIVAGISRGQRVELEGLGITTRRALGRAEGLDRKFERVREQARLQLRTTDEGALAYELLEPERDSDGRPLADRGLSALPQPAQGDLFFDIEGDPFAFWSGLEYLFGVWDGSRYESTWALSLAEEKGAFEAVIDRFRRQLEAHPDMHVYHYGAYEPSHLKRLAGRHATRQDELDDMLRRGVFVDLYRVVRQGVRVGAESYSIKKLEPLYAYRREIDLREAGDSIAEFELWLGTAEGERDDSLLKDIEAYNRDDCISTQALRDWLERVRPTHLPRPTSADGAVGEDLSDHIRAVADLTARLTATIPTDPAEQSEAQRATWLLANLLDWHRRENKATYWRYYDLLDKTDEELLVEKEPLAGLEFVSTWPLPRPARSDIWRYRFPAGQEFDIDQGTELHDPRLPANDNGTGTCDAIDADAGTIDIKRGRGWAGTHPTAVVPLNVYRADAQFGSLMALGEWVAEHGIDADDDEGRAARNLLLRRAPLVLDGAPLRRADESGADAALRLATLLGGTTLAIQGPPGSGKSTRGAQMIAALVAAGRRVGITSNSHKVIGNLLWKALEAGVGAAIQKADQDEAVDDPRVKRASSNIQVADALRSGEVGLGAGTPWVWAHADLAGSVDTLFVDEAGQVSLANVVAMSRAARNIVLLGDPQQLDQPTQGVHPDGAGVSALAHLLGTEKVMPAGQGLFLEHTHRMHPEIIEYTSAQFYEGALEGDADLVRQGVLGDGLPPSFAWLAGAGLRWVPVEHVGRTNESIEEAGVVADIWRALLGRRWTDRAGATRTLTADDVLIISPFNAQRRLVAGLLGDSARVGTVDKFQGQQAPVSIYTMASSSRDDAPRGMDFLYSLNRLNVATSRAQALAIVVCSPALLDAVARTPAQLRMANSLVAFADQSA